MIVQLLHFIDIDDATRDRGPEIWQIIEPHADAIIANFYSRVKNFEIGAHFDDVTIRRLMVKQKRHWQALFDSRFDDIYANSVRQVGIQHRNIALSPMWYVAGYMGLKIAFTELLADATLPPVKKGRLIKALDKYVAFDMALALSTYDAVLVD